MVGTDISVVLFHNPSLWLISNLQWCFCFFFFFYNSHKSLFMHTEHYTSFLFFAIWMQLIHTCMHISFFIYSFHLCVCMHMTRGNQRTAFIFRWVLAIELPSLGLHSECFYLLSHLAAKEHAHFKNIFFLLANLITSV